MRQHDLAGVTPDERKLVTAWDSAYDAWARHEKLEKLSKRRAYQQKRLKYSKEMARDLRREAKRLEKDAAKMLKASDNAAALKDMEKAQADQKKIDYFAKEEQKNQDCLTRIEDALDLLRTAASETSLAAQMGNYTVLEMDMNHTEKLKNLVQYMYQSATSHKNNKHTKFVTNHTLIKMKHMLDSAGMKRSPACASS